MYFIYIFDFLQIKFSLLNINLLSQKSCLLIEITNFFQCMCDQRTKTMDIFGDSDCGKFFRIWVTAYTLHPSLREYKVGLERVSIKSNFEKIVSIYFTAVSKLLYIYFRVFIIKKGLTIRKLSKKPYKSSVLRVHPLNPTKTKNIWKTSKVNIVPSARDPIIGYIAVIITIF